MAKPVALVTNTVPDYRVEPFKLLHEREGLEVLTWHDPGAPVSGVPVKAVSQREVAHLIASGRYRAVIGGLGGRIALPAAYLGARRARVPFVLWASLWEHPYTLTHRLSRIPLGAIYRGADAVATYGPHVSKFVAHSRGAKGKVFEAHQAADPLHQKRAEPRRPEQVGDGFLLLFVGRLEHEKGVDVLLAAWRKANIEGGTLALAGEGPITPTGPGVIALGKLDRDALPALYAAADAVVLPSVPTATFREPWGLVVNEAMHQGTPVITSDAVGAAAGGLVAHERNGLVVPHGDIAALAGAIGRLATDRESRDRLGEQALRDVATYTPQAWADGMSRALRAAEAERPLC